MEVERLKIIIERSLADGRLSRLESEIIRTAIYHNKTVTRQETELFRQLQEKIWQGEVAIDDSD